MTSGSSDADAQPVDTVAREVLEPTAPTADAPVDVTAVSPPVRISARWWPLAAIGLVGLGALAAAVAHPGTVVWQADEALHSFALDHRGPADAWVARVVTWGGATSVALPALILVGAVARSGRPDLRTRIGAGMLLGGSAALGVWLGLALNNEVGRVRPPVVDWWTTAGGPAFPSGHTTAATIVAGLGAWALTQRTTSTVRRRAVWTGAVGYALLVGWSRYWLGVHWPSDVLGGWLLGASWVVVVTTTVTLVARRSPPRWFVPGKSLRA